jgi:SAM-dependent methyltransferase
MNAHVAWTPAAVREAWDPRADRYLELFRDELEAKPYDQAALQAFAARVGADGRVVDVGCGPCGHVAALLTRLGLETLSVDLSPRCVELARREQPQLRFEVMDLAALALPVGAIDGLVAYYALHDQPRARLDATFAEFARVLRPGGQLLVVAKEGTEEGLVADPLGSGLTVYWASQTGPGLAARATAAGFRVETCEVREPLPGEIAARRVYLAAERA